MSELFCFLSFPFKFEDFADVMKKQIYVLSIDLMISVIMKTRYLTVIVLFFCFLPGVSGQKKFTVSGYVSDASSGEKLIGANVYNPPTASGAVSNVYGFYSITLPAGETELIFSYVGYGKQIHRFLLQKDTVLNVGLEQSTEIDEVVVTAKESQRIEHETQMSMTDIPIRQIQALPSLLGETDLLKTVQLLPGVQSGNEGQSGFYVRGGSPDQNLILLDGVPVYNASHLFGFFSIFNTDAISDVKLIKGGFPARYGGRLSSVLDIRMKDGNLHEYHGDVTLGLISAKGTFEGPVVKDKTSFIVSGRRTYADFIARPFIKKGFKESGEEGEAGYYFYDINAKVTHTFSSKDRVFLSVYNGNDRFYFKSHYRVPDYEENMQNKLNWGNTIAAGRWNHIWSGKLFSNTTFTYSRYNMGTFMAYKYIETMQDTSREDARLQYTSGIDDLALHIDFDYIPAPAHYIRFGFQGIYHRFNPGVFDFSYLEGEKETRVDTVIGQKILYAGELSIFAEDDWRITDNLKANIGLHFSSFVTRKKQYYSLQPRVSVRYLLPGGVALKGSYATMRQYIQLLAFSSIGLPTDLWLPTTAKVKPQDSWQVAAGMAKTLGNLVEVSIEGYYKKMHHVISYKEGAGMMQFDDWQERVTQGDGWSYGMELFINKKKGKWTGWLGYTLAWSWRQFDDLNFGKKFHYTYDRRHDISLVSVYELNDRIHLSGTWVFGTGNAYTLANSTYYGFFPSEGFDMTTEVNYYEQRNNYRMRPYNRLDLGVDFIRKRKHWTRKLSVGAYNVYSRKNPFFMNIENNYIYDEETGEPALKRELVQYSLFPIIPYCSLNIHF